MRLRRYDKTEFEVVEEDEGIAKVRCENCGHEQTEFKGLAVAAESIECADCGHEKRFKSHTGLAFLLVVAALMWYGVKVWYQRFRIVVGLD